MEGEIRYILNRYSAENTSNTPDFILAQFLLACLDAFNAGVKDRDTWYGISPTPGGNR